jgi:hypothetical protein
LNIRLVSGSGLDTWHNRQQPNPAATALPDAQIIDEQTSQGRPLRLGWAKLFKRMFDLDMDHCPCGGG